MQHWLSSTWEANWRSFQYFNLYRLVLAALFFLAIVFPHEWTARLNLLPSPLMFWLTGSYMAATVAGLLLALATSIQSPIVCPDAGRRGGGQFAHVPGGWCS